MEGNQPNNFRKTSALLRQQTLGPSEDQRTFPRVYGPRTRQGLFYKLYLASHPYIQDFAGHRILQLPGLRGNIHFLHIRRPVLHIAGGSMFCGVPWSTKTFRILKIHGQSPLGCKVSSCSVYLCYLFNDTGCAWYGHYHWNFG